MSGSSLVSSARSPCSSSCSSSSSLSMSSSAQLRKIKKPLIERKRRERINICLNQLKSLVLEALNKNESCYSKMEKADILEMTVAHLKAMQQRHLACARDSQSSPAAATTKYASGYRECANEVQKYLSAIDIKDKLEVGVRSSLIRYLGTRLEEVEKSIGENSNNVNVYPPLLPFQCTSSNSEAEMLVSGAQIQFKGTSSTSKIIERRSPASRGSSPTPHGILICNSLVSNSMDNVTRILYRLQQSDHETTSAGIPSEAFNRSTDQENLTRLLAAVPASQLTSAKLPVSVGLACFSTPYTSLESITTTKASTKLTSRFHMKSPTQGDEFPQTLTSPGFTSSAVLLHSHLNSKVVPANQSVEPVPMPPTEVWRPW